MIFLNYQYMLFIQYKILKIIHHFNCSLGDKYFILSMLEQSFYIRLCIYYILLFCTNGFKTNLKIGLWAWRIGTFYIFFDTLASFFYSENIANKLFLLLSLIHCLIIMPFFSQNSTCRNCGRRNYYQPLLFNKCCHCNMKY